MKRMNNCVDVKMVEIVVIAAVAKNNVIGNNGDIPWRIKEDFLHFKNKTMGHPCIMGSKTYESLPDFAKPLPGRENLVLSSRSEYRPEGTKVFSSFEEAVAHCEDNGAEKVFICGGSSVYGMGLEVADTFELTKINMEPEGDTHFPEVDFDQWELAEHKDCGEYSFNTYKRKEN